jgi:hypothetical protein
MPATDVCSDLPAVIWNTTTEIELIFYYWGHIDLTGDYVWNAQQETNLDNLRSLENRAQST